MIRYVIRRILLMIPVLIGVTLLIFVLQSMTPGDPAKLVLGPSAEEQELNMWRDKYGLNDPVIVQYGKYMAGLVRGDFGISYRTGRSITTTVLERWPTTFLLALLSLVVSVAIGMLLGIVAALNRRSWIDSVIRFLGMIGSSMPNFWFALLLIMLFALNLKILPVSGFYGPRYWVLPSATLGILGSAGILRITRSAMLDNINADFVRTARSKGQSEGVITFRHVLGNAMIPIVTSVGGMFAMSLGGTIVLEQIFAIAGLGKLMLDAINQRDFPVVRGTVLLMAITTCVINLLIDIIYSMIDPRVKAAFKNSLKPIKFVEKIKEKRAEKAGREGAAS